MLIRRRQMVTTDPINITATSIVDIAVDLLKKKRYLAKHFLPGQIRKIDSRA